MGNTRGTTLARGRRRRSPGTKARKRKAPTNEFQGLLRTLAQSVESLGPAGQGDTIERDPESVTQIAGLMRIAARYYAAEIRGWDDLPAKGPMLIVGNHSGGLQTMDPVPLFARWVEERGPESVPYILAHDIFFRYPVIGPWMRRIGITPANRINAKKILRAGGSVIVFPGGDYEIFRPWSERNKIEFNGRRGFVSLALETGAPVIPMTIHGAHNAVIILDRGEEVAERLGFGEYRMGVAPLMWNIPFGPVPAAIPSIPLPTKITVQLGQPMDWSRYEGRKAKSPQVLERCYEEIVAAMQADMDRLAEERPYPVLSRLSEVPGELLSLLRGAM